MLAGAAVVGAVLIATLPIPPHEPRRGARRGGAWVALWRRPALASVTAGTSLSMAGTGALPLVTAGIAGVLGDPAMTGLALSVMAAGLKVTAAAAGAAVAGAAAGLGPAVLLVAVAAGQLVAGGAAYALLRRGQVLERRAGALGVQRGQH